MHIRKVLQRKKHNRHAFLPSKSKNPLIITIILESLWTAETTQPTGTAAKLH